MKIFYSLFLFLLLPLTACNTSSDNHATDSALKIYNGVQIPEEESPQFVQVNVTTSDNSEYLCTGTVIGSNSVLTAAHCLNLPNIVSATINFNEQVYLISNIAVSPGFSENEVAFFNDIAIAGTELPLNLPTLPILSSIPLDVSNPLMIYGYGLNESGEYGLLRSGLIYPDEITPNHIIDIVEGDQNTCAGDSGGPVIATVELTDGQLVSALVGVTSCGTSEECTNRETALYINLQNPELVQFITNQVPDAVIF